MGLADRITLPPAGRSPGGLLGAARPLPGRWTSGVTFASSQCVLPQNVGICTNGDVTKVPGRLSDAATFEAFGVVLALECSTMGRSDLSGFTDTSLDVTREYAVASELLTGAASGNPALKDATSLGTASDAVAALACLDQKIGTLLGGRLGFIHAAPAIATYLLSAAAIYKEGQRFYTASGNIVVISAGYDGRAPTGVGNLSSPAVAGNSLYLYATGEVYAAVGERDSFDAVQRGTNVAQSIAEDAAIAAFDPCFLLAVDTGVELCGGIS